MTSSVENLLLRAWKNISPECTGQPIKMKRIPADRIRNAEEQVIKATLSRHKKYTTVVNRRTYVVLPRVFSPRYAAESKLFAKHLPNQKGKEVLEIGSGTGVLAITAALQGARRVVAVDISARAVQNTIENMHRHKVEGIVEAYRSDIFKAIPRDMRFDTILWNIPWGNFGRYKRLSLIERAFFDPEYRHLRRYVTSAPKFLKPDGSLLIGYSTSVGNQTKLEMLLRKTGFSWRVIVRHRASIGRPHVAIRIELFEAKLSA